MSGKPRYTPMQIARIYALQESRVLREYARLGVRPSPATPTAFPWRPNFINITERMERSDVLPDARDRSGEPHLRRAS